MRELSCPWQPFSACSTTTRSTATRRPTRATTCRRSSATPTARARRPRRRSTSRPGELLGSVSGELGLRRFLEGRGHRLVVTSDKDGPDSVFERELPEAEVVISQPFWPAYLTAERIAKAPKLKLALTAGIGSDHVDLQAAIERGITVAEVTYSQQHQRRRARGDDDPRAGPQLHPLLPEVVDGGWNIADCVSRSYDLEGMQVGTVAAGRIGSAVLRRLKPFDVGLHYTDRHRLPAEVEEELGAHLPPRRRVDGRGLRRGHDQRAAAPGDRAPLRRRAAGEDEARRLPDQHRPRQDLRPRRGRGGLRERAAGRLRRRRLVPAAARPRTTPGGRCPTTA